MPSWVWITAAAMAAWVLFIALTREWWRSVWYSWARAAHVIEQAQKAEPGVVPEYGSMSLLDELAFRKNQSIHEKIMRDLTEGPPGDGTFAFTVGQPDWRDQTMAELAPGALDDDEAVLYRKYPVEWDDDSGPGVGVLLAPGPDPGGDELPFSHPIPGVIVRRPPPGLSEDEEWDWLNHPHAAPSRLADTGDIMNATLAADVAADMRARDDDTAAYLSRLTSDTVAYRRNLAASLT